MIRKFLQHKKKNDFMASDFFKYIGPGFIVTVGFIDPGNWASNIAAGSEYGYKLLWMVTLSTFMLTVLQHNCAHLGIKTGYCLSEATSIFLNPVLSKGLLISALLAAVSTALAEVLGGAIALNMIFKLPIRLGAILIAVLVMFMVFTNSYKRMEKYIIGFVSIIGVSFIVELSLMKINWNNAVLGWVMPVVPKNSIPIIMSVLGAVVMPHNLYLHSEIIQSRQWNLEDEEVISHQLKYEFMDTLFSMITGWAINSAMIIVAAATFYAAKVQVTELSQAQAMLSPMLGKVASSIFALALLLSGISSSVTAAMAGGSIYAGMYKEPYDINDRHTGLGVLLTVLPTVLIIFLIKDPFKGLVLSQMLLSVQLPFTIILQIYLTSSEKVMGKYANSTPSKIILWTIAVVVISLNLILLTTL